MLDIVKRMDEKYVMTGETGSYRYMAPEVRSRDLPRVTAPKCCKSFGAAPGA